MWYRYSSSYIVSVLKYIVNFSSKGHKIDELFKTEPNNFDQVEKLLGIEA